MKISLLQTGWVTVKESFLHPAPGWRRQPALFMPGPWADPIPIYLWLIEHEGRRILVDAGETADARNTPFARVDVTPEQELPGALASVKLTPDDLDTVILTHLHGDHFHGTVHLTGPVLVGADEWRFNHTVRGRFAQLVGRAPLPAAVPFQTLTLDAGPFGAFEHSAALTEDGRVLAVASPGHTSGHLSVIAIDDDGHHVVLAGDLTDTLEQLYDRRSDAVAPDPAVHVRTIERVHEHAARHPLVYLPSHDRDSPARLAARTTLVAPG